MRLIVSPKEAVQKIDALIKEGYELRECIVDDYERKRNEAWEREDEDNDDESENETENEDQHQKIAPEFESFMPSIKFAQKELERVKKMAESYQPHIELNKKDVSDEIIDGYKKKQDTWFNSCLTILKDIYKDFAPIYIFYERLSLTKFDIGLGDPNFREYIHVVDRIDSRLSALVDFYNDLKDQVRSPLNYLEKKAQIWFYDFVCQLTPSSNESALCGYMFQYGIGEYRSYADIYEYIFGEIEDTSDKLPKGWKVKVRSAYDGINRKTNKSFGFNILSKKGYAIALHFPSRLIGSGL